MAHFKIQASCFFLYVIQQLLISFSSSSYPFDISFYLSFNNTFEQEVPTQYVTNPASLSSFYLM